MASGPERGEPAFRIDWWVPVAGDPGEWAGRWRRVAGTAAARDAARAALRSDTALGLVLVTALDVDGAPLTKVALDAAEVEAWDTGGALPVGTRAADVLPPAGRDDVECATLLACRDALLVAHAVGLVHRAVVTAILEIVQQAFVGAGPAIDIAALVAPEVFSTTPGRAS